MQASETGVVEDEAHAAAHDEPALEPEHEDVED